MIQNIIFDMGQVLLYFNPGMYIESLGISGEDSDILLREVFRKMEWVQLDHGTITEEEAVKAICKRVPGRLYGAVEELVFFWWKRPIVPVPGMEALMKELKEAGYKLYLLSNASVQQIRYHDRIPGTQYLDGRIVSAEWKQIKPQPEIYKTLLDTYSLKAEECVFIDDSAVNVEAAYCMGIHGIVFDDDVSRLKSGLRALGVAVTAE